MATNDFKPFATGSGANVLSQADYGHYLPHGIREGR